MQSFKNVTTFFFTCFLSSCGIIKNKNIFRTDSPTSFAGVNADTSNTVKSAVPIAPPISKMTPQSVASAANGTQAVGNLVGCKPSDMLTDTQLSNAPSNGWKSVDVRNYFPKPAQGTSRINMYGVLDYKCDPYYTNAERIGDQDWSVNGRQKIDDYAIDTTGKYVVKWRASWYFFNNDKGVLETTDFFPAIDNFPAGSYDISKYPFDHGKIVSVGGAGPNVDSTASGLLTATGHIHQTRYRIFMQDIKTTISLPGGTFNNVTMQAEQQDFCDYTAGQCPTAAASEKYKWYFAPNMGFIAMTSFDADWKSKNTMVLLKTCIGKADQYVCP